jgi:hypothetical protein
MKLYHYTDLWPLEKGGTILAEGLKAAAGGRHAELPPSEPVVWLTSEDTPIRWSSRAPEVRITLDLQPNSRRLVRWEDWLRKHEPKLFDALNSGRIEMPSGNSWKCWYCYFGDIPPSKFQAIEYYPDAVKQDVA